MANASQHLQHLRQAGLVRPRREGQRVIYGLTGDEVVDLLATLRSVAEANLAEVSRLVDDYLNAKDDLEPVQAEALLERARAGEVTVLDVRPSEEFEVGHLPTAVNLPLGELETRIAELPPGQPVVAYCRGPYCVLAYDAVVRLREAGFHARRLDGGLPEWRRAGLPVES